MPHGGVSPKAIRREALCSSVRTKYSDEHAPSKPTRSPRRVVALLAVGGPSFLLTGGEVPCLLLRSNICTSLCDMCAHSRQGAHFPCTIPMLLAWRDGLAVMIGILRNNGFFVPFLMWFPSPWLKYDLKYFRRHPHLTLRFTDLSVRDNFVSFSGFCSIFLGSSRKNLSK